MDPDEGKHAVRDEYQPAAAAQHRALRRPTLAEEAKKPLDAAVAEGTVHGSLRGGAGGDTLVEPLNDPGQA
jgi:hypothetical protein